MRQKFSIEYERGAEPIDQVNIPEKSRDELPRVLRALQYIYTHPDLSKAIFDILEQKVVSKVKNKQMGREGMSLWEIVVLAVVRLALDIDYDRLEHIANYDLLVRAIMGVSSFGENIKRYPLQTIKDNVGLLDAETIDKINEVVVKAGQELAKKRTKN